jgi:hypothetical protein
MPLLSLKAWCGLGEKERTENVLVFPIMSFPMRILKLSSARISPRSKIRPRHSEPWPSVTVATGLAKVCLWSSGRRMELVSLTWDQLKVVGTEYHFEMTGKWGIEKWFRIPEQLYRDLVANKTNNPYVFAAYNQQLRCFYESSRTPWKVNMVGEEFKPVNLGDWFHKCIVHWSASTGNGHATTHIFRKTGLQYALRGESASSRVARVGEAVLMRHYAKLTDLERRDESNRTYARLVASLDPAVAARYGLVTSSAASLNWQLPRPNTRPWSSNSLPN